MAAITAQATPARRHAMRSPTLYGLMASGHRLDQGPAPFSGEWSSPGWEPSRCGRDVGEAVLSARAAVRPHLRHPQSLLAISSTARA